MSTVARSLQCLLEDRHVENIVITGAAQVQVQRADVWVPGAPVAESDAALLDAISRGDL